MGMSYQHFMIRRKRWQARQLRVGDCGAGVSRAVGNLGGPGAIHAVLGLANHKVSHTRKDKSAPSAREPLYPEAAQVRWTITMPQTVLCLTKL